MKLRSSVVVLGLFLTGSLALAAGHQRDQDQYDDLNSAIRCLNQFGETNDLVTFNHSEGQQPGKACHGIAAGCECPYFWKDEISWTKSSGDVVSISIDQKHDCETDPNELMSDRKIKFAIVMPKERRLSASEQKSTLLEARALIAEKIKLGYAGLKRDFKGKSQKQIDDEMSKLNSTLFADSACARANQYDSVIGPAIKAAGDRVCSSNKDADKGGRCMLSYRKDISPSGNTNSGSAAPAPR
jgi:hypothetical protein